MPPGGSVDPRSDSHAGGDGGGDGTPAGRAQRACDRAQDLRSTRPVHGQSARLQERGRTAETWHSAGWIKCGRG